eukprot:202596-Prymnesium_polylepis.3
MLACPFEIKRAPPSPSRAVEFTIVLPPTKEKEPPLIHTAPPSSRAVEPMIELPRDTRKG